MLNPADLTGVLGDNEDAQIVGARICRHDEKTNLLRMVGIRGTHNSFAVLKLDFGFAALGHRVQRLKLLIFRIAHEILGEENCFKIFHLHVGAFTLLRVLLKEKAKAVFLGGKIINVAFEPAAVDISNHVE